MTLSTFSHVLGAGTILLGIVIIAVIIMRIVFGKQSTVIQKIVQFAVPVGFFLGFAGVTGSLIYSEIYQLTPCLFCWWQRIFIYPQVILFAMAWYRIEKGFASAREAFYYTTPFAIIGTFVSLYHILLQRGMVGPGGSCLLNGTPCNVISYQVYGFITIPVMAFAIGLAISLLGYLVLSNKK
jgi:disulfide bond formation protein DsbB